jgi:hypothetical protein
MEILNFSRLFLVEILVFQFIVVILFLQKGWHTLAVLQNGYVLGLTGSRCQ